MGRKLNALEEIQSSLPNTEADADRQAGLARLERNLQLQRRIADQLGISTAQLRDPPPPVVRETGTAARPDDVVLTQQCVLAQQCADLVEAFSRIADPEERLRCLRIVRDAALR